MTDVIKSLEESKEVIRKEIDTVEAVHSALEDYIDTTKDVLDELGYVLEQLKSIM